MHQHAGQFGFSFDVSSVDWHADYTGGGRASAQPLGPPVPKAEAAKPLKPQYPNLTLTPFFLNDGAQASDFMQNLILPTPPQGKMQARMQDVASKRFTGSRAGIEQQLFQGFMDAGRPDLANMVGTPAFTTWINAESGWRVNAQSAANNHGQANGGLFQFWYGHAFTGPYQGGNGFTASAYQQARMVAKYFGHLTPAAIGRYAQQINNGTYGGWG
jgi:hypothetical protein